MKLNSVNFIHQEKTGILTELLCAIKECNLTEIRNLLIYIDKVHINKTYGPLHISALELACSFPPEKSLPLAKLLISNGAKASNKDKFGRTALHYACNHGNLELVQLLLDNEADVVINSKYENVKYLSTQNFHGFYNMGIAECLPVPEYSGRRPLHEATQRNHKEIVKLLLERGALVNIKDEHGITPLLLAGSGVKQNELQDYEEIVSLLVQHNARVNVYSNYTGTSPLHHSVALNSLAATETLLNARAKIQIGSFGQTPIHEAAKKGYSNILSLLLTYEDITINIPDEEGRTALHNAAFAGAGECVRVLIDHGGDLSAKTKYHTTVMDAIFRHIPRPVTFMKEILDTKITSNNVSVNDTNFQVTLDFEMLTSSRTGQQLSVVAAILNLENERQSLDVIQHPLIDAFLRLKWIKLRIFFKLLVLIHFIFVGSLSSYVMLLVYRPSWFWTGHFIMLTRTILSISAFTLFGYGILQYLLVARHNFRQYEMWLNLICPSISLIVAFAGSNETKRENVSGLNIIFFSEPEKWMLHCASIVVLFAWLQIMLLIGRFSSCGYYALMFSAVLQNVIKVLLIFVCLLFGFALSFSIQFSTYEQFSNPWRAFVRTVVMMMGEFEYADLFDDKSTKDNSNPSYLKATSRLIFLLFIILCNIVLMNTMVGLAVSDIQELQKEGNAKRIAKQATFLSHIEKVLSNRFFKFLLKDTYNFLQARRSLNVILVLKPGRKGMTHEMNFTNFCKHLPSNLLESIIDIAVNNNSPHSCKCEDRNERKLLCRLIAALKLLEDEKKVKSKRSVTK